LYLPDIELHEATTLVEAHALLASYAPDARLLAGGTDLLVDLKTGRVTTRHLISCGRIEALHGVTAMERGLRVGALTTITQLDRAIAGQDRYAALREATRQMASPQIRNIATVGGNIASAVPCADLPGPLIAMHATVLLSAAQGDREVALDKFFVGPRQTVRRDDEVLTAVIVPQPPPGFGAAYARFALREGNAIAVAAVAASLLLESDQTVRQARIVLGAVAPIPVLVEPAGAALVGRVPSEDAFDQAAQAAMQAAAPISDVRGSAEYRRTLIGVLTGRALQAALRRAKEAE
jgi:CO/xanthine dehydrogenase FAD-binding subunit